MIPAESAESVCTPMVISSGWRAVAVGDGAGSRGSRGEFDVGCAGMPRIVAMIPPILTVIVVSWGCWFGGLETVGLGSAKRFTAGSVIEGFGSAGKVV